MTFTFVFCLGAVLLCKDLYVMPDTKYLVSGIRYQVSSTRYHERPIVRTFNRYETSRTYIRHVTIIHHVEVGYRRRPRSCLFHGIGMLRMYFSACSVGSLVQHGLFSFVASPPRPAMERLIFRSVYWVCGCSSRYPRTNLRLFGKNTVG